MELRAVTIDCANPAELADFYGRLLGVEVTHSSEEFASVAVRTDLSVLFERVEGYKAPSWPSQDVPQQVHLDLGSDDLDAAEGRALALGASKPSEQPGGDRWRVLLDPQGHPFCLTSN